MKGKITNLLRWLFALALVGFGSYCFVEIVGSALKSKGDWFAYWMDAFLFFVLVLVPVGMGYLVYRRRYHELCSVLAMLGSIVLCFILMGLPRHFGWYRALDWLGHTTGLGLLGLFMSLLFLFGPFIAAGWFHRMCIRLADRYLPTSKPRKWPGLDGGTKG